MKLENGKLFFDSGREFSPVCGVVGLCVDETPESASGQIYSGYDDDCFIEKEPKHTGYAFMSSVEAVELADFMVERWSAFRERHAAPLQALSKDQADRLRGDLAAVAAAFGQLAEDLKK